MKESARIRRIRGIRGDKRGNIELRVLRVVLDWGRGLGLVGVGVLDVILILIESNGLG